MSSAAANVKEPITGETEDAMRYRSLVDAVRFINKSRQQIDKEEDLGFTISPAWRLLNNAARHLLMQANAILRQEEL